MIDTYSPANPASNLQQERLHGNRSPHRPRLTDNHFFEKIRDDISFGDDPQKYSSFKKAVIIFIVALSSMTGTMGSMIYMPGITEITNDFNSSSSGINGSIAAYIVFLGIAPLFWASMSEVHGRKPMYIISIALSVIGSIICAVSKNIIMFIVFRAVQACGTSSGQTLGAGVISDIIGASKRGRAYGVFYVGSLLGPAIGPAVGGVLCYYLGWRSTFYFLTILKTLRKRLNDSTYDDKQQSELNNNANQYNQHKKERNTFMSTFVMLGDPTVLLITLYNTIIFASLYFLNPTISTLFHSLYNLNSWQIGLCYFVFGIGLMFGSIISGRYIDYMFSKLKNTNDEEQRVIPESRLRAAFPAFMLIPVGYIIYGWTSETGAGLYAPLIGLFIYALGQMFAFNPTNVYLVDSKPGRSASALAINNCVRFVVAAITTIFSSNALSLVGPGILFTALAAINVLNSFALLLVMFRGER